MMSTGPRFKACTTTTRAQLPAARVLCESLQRYHPEAEIVLLVVDDVDRVERAPAGIRLVTPADITPPEVFARLTMAHSASELTDALTPCLVRALAEEGAPAVVAFGPDTEVLAPFPEVIELAGEHGIVLTPRLDAPLPDDGLEPTPTQLRKVGPFASEFVGVGPTAAEFLDWWCDRQERAALDRAGSQSWGLWTEAVTSLFQYHALREPAYGASVWNAHERPIRATEHGFEVAGERLRWFHFDGYSPDNTAMLSADLERPRVRLSDRPGLARLCDDHGARLRAAGYDETEPPYGYASLPDGRQIDARMRRMYFDALQEASDRGGPEPPSAFAFGGPEAFVAWLAEPAAPPPEPLVSRYLTRVWADDRSVQDVFPSLAGEGAEEYLGWIRTTGQHDHDVPAWVLPSEEDVLELMKRRWKARPTGPRPRGVNLVGYVTAVLGVGEVARLIASTMDNARVPTAIVANRTTMSRQSVAFDSTSAGAAPYDVNLLCVNADHTTHLAQELGPEFFAGRRSIGVWFWEVEDFPPSMKEAFPVLDEVWVASDFVLEAIAPASPRPVRKFPLPVPVPTVPKGVTRSEVGLPEDRFVFLFVYDFFSTAERKNPVGLIDAFTRAFRPHEGPVLVLKSINGDQRVAELERVRLAAADRPDVIVRDEYLSTEHHSALLGHCDAYVSLHRSEGFGMDMAKAMGLGKPVVATGYSGNLEFMDDAISYLVDYDLEVVGPGREPYPSVSRWASPRLDHAAELMRRIVERPDEARERGRRAADRIHTDFSIASRAAEITPLLDDARARGGHAPWRAFFMDGWRERRRRRERLPSGTVDWLLDGVPIDVTMRGLLTTGGADVPDPEGDLDAFYTWLDERVFPAKTPVVSRYLHRLWCDRRDLQSHFPNIEADPRGYLQWLVDHGHADTDVPDRLLPTSDDLRKLTSYQERQARRDRLTRAVRTAGQRAAGLVSRR